MEMIEENIKKEDLIKNRDPSAQRINFSEEIMIPKDLTKLELKINVEKISSIIIEDVKKVNDAKVIENFTGKIKVMRMDGMSEDRNIDGKDLVSAKIIDELNTKKEFLFDPNGFNPIVEVISTNLENIKVNKDTSSLLIEKAKDRVGKLCYKRKIFNKEKLEIKTFKDVHIILDESGSMGRYNKKVKEEIKIKFGLDIKNIKSIDDCSFKMKCELYDAITEVINKSELGEAIYFISDFCDKTDNTTKEAAIEIEKSLLDKSISLYLHSVCTEIYEDLKKVAINTGGWAAICEDI
jgi:hypothetical protein